ncbi:probable LRR receptor-like serine/threonine-protein kinase At1g53430 isoform X2 [Ziziphus jujuba]|uniref:non-specific serine/threonine protein kinase n=1 Tax=Ziziphus jujuba TaxID=326968 RepID=A0ABM4AAG2_ZIZJJ|nr:probable LRR receptor-like serine/threonine-protein kinase At1g53430 isoform X2 [Ziziphus jujuba]
MSSEPSLWRLEKFIFLLYYSLLWLLSSQLIKFQIVADQLLPDDEVLALNVIADKLELKSVPYFTDQFCNRSASLYDVGIYCNCSYQKSTVCHIEDISLSNRGLTGIIPEELAKLTYLQTLVLSDNKLYGVIPASLGKLQFLYKVDLSNNLLTGHIPDNLGKLNPQISNMSENVGCASGTYQRQCYRSSPDTVGTMICAFFTLDLSMNQLNGPIPDSLGNIRVSLSNNRLSGSIPATFGNLKLLSSLKLGENNLTGTLPDTLGNLKSLSSLWLQSNYFTGDLPESYANLSGLYSFSISGNFLSGPFPNFIKSWTSIRTLSLYGNNFNGSISPEIFKLPNLANLMISDVSNTSFQFPKEAKSSYMTNLIMRNCSITDEIPNYLFTMSSLKYLDLSFNNLTGRIPDSSTNLSLTYMSFANNKLDGKIPAWIGAARRIKIDLSNNSFSTLGFQLPSKGDLNLFNCCKPSSTAPTMTSLNQMIEKRCPGGKPTNHSLFINCGGEETSIDGNHYDSDNETSQFHVSRKGNWAYSNSGGFLSTSVNSSEYIRRVKCGISVAQAPLYEKARLSPTSLKYYGFCLRKGSYNVTLHFAEIVYAEDEDLSSSMKRIFDVYIQGERQLTDFNIQDSARGPNKNIAITNLTANVTNDSVLEIHLYWTGKGSPADSPQFNGPLISAIAVTPEFPIEDDKGLSPAHISLITVASIVFAGLLLLALAWAMGCFGKEELHEINVGLEKPVTLKQLKDATRKFSKEMEIGHGSFGIVYRAEVQPKYNVAVKRFFTNSIEGINKLKSEFYNTLQKLKHENLVRLFDVYVGKGMHLLIYEYMENRSLQDVLFGESNGRITLDWKDRYKICLGIASGLKYLHDELPKGPRFKMVHRGIKPSNILLDGNLNAKISDFGNSVLYAEDYQENQFKVMKEEASHGYMAPEYLMFGAISCKYDVYGYGVVILEIVCGRRNAGQKLNQEQLDFLVEEVVLAESEGRLHEMVDKNLLVYDETEAMKILKLAVKCTNISASFRPTMSEVVSVLKGEKTIDDIWKPASTQILCQNCFKSLHEDDGVGDQQHA